VKNKTQAEEKEFKLEGGFVVPDANAFGHTFRYWFNFPVNLIYWGILIHEINFCFKIKEDFHNACLNSDDLFFLFAFKAWSPC
jgi:hypothetical protein